MPWKSWRNAEIYDAYVREHSIYRQLNGHLVDLSDIETARRILDLACGSGATTAACLATMPAGSEIVGVDGSDAMVGVARARTIDPRARFEVAAAADVGRIVEGTFDRCLCNAAIWQFPSIPNVIRAVARLLVPGGLFVFNVPAERLGEGETIHPFQIALARAIERRSGSRLHSPRLVEGESIDEGLLDAGFSIERKDQFSWRGRQGELQKLMEIPAMIEPLTPGLDDTARSEILTEAARSSDPREVVVVPWVYFVARRQDSKS